MHIKIDNQVFPIMVDTDDRVFFCGDCDGYYFESSTLEGLLQNIKEAGCTATIIED